jgi:hypothetical protein
MNHRGSRRIPGPGMSPAPSTTPDMQQNPPPQSPCQAPELPARPEVVPILPTRVRQPGRRAPLPDAVAVSRLAVPDAAPPYDDEQAEPARVRADDDPPQPPAGRPPAGPRPPEHGGWPSQFAQVLAETLAGSRPAQQLTPWTTEQARRRIRQLGPLLVTDQRPRVRRVVTSAPSQDVLELTAVVGFGTRIRALAVRLERGKDPAHPAGGERWCCTAIESA